MSEEQLEVYFAFRYAMSHLPVRLRTKHDPIQNTITVVASSDKVWRATMVSSDHVWIPNALDLIAERFTRAWEKLT